MINTFPTSLTAFYPYTATTWTAHAASIPTLTATTTSSCTNTSMYHLIPRVLSKNIGCFFVHWLDILGLFNDNANLRHIINKVIMYVFIEVVEFLPAHIQP